MVVPLFVNNSYVYPVAFTSQNSVGVTNKQVVFALIGFKQISSSKPLTLVVIVNKVNIVNNSDHI